MIAALDERQQDRHEPDADHVGADEVQAGYCRTGRWWGYEGTGFTPDIVVTGKPMVLGTTGFIAAQLAEIRSLAQHMPLFMAPNMSPAINVMYKLIADAARLLGSDFDIEILEAHHRYKVDAPSGTAVRMAEILAQTLNRDLEKVAVHGRQGIVGQRKDEEIAILSIRAGDLTGDHTVTFGGIGERLEIIHRTQSRDAFGRGALRAARWIVQQKPGLYDMQDLLGLK